MTILIITVITLLLSGFFSGSEIAFFTLTDAKVHTLRKNKVKGAETLYKLMRNKEKLLITLLIGNNLVIISSSAIITVLVTNRYGAQSLGIASGVLTFLILTFGEILPKIIASQKNIKIALTVAYPFYLLQVLLTPVTYFFEILTKVVNKNIGIKTKNAHDVEEELTSLAMLGAQEGILETHEEELIKNVFRLNDIKVRSAMTKRDKVFCVGAEEQLSSIVKDIRENHYSRIPVSEEGTDEIIGFLYIKDLVIVPRQEWQSKKVADYMRNVMFVNENKVISDLYEDFIRTHSHLAVVIDNEKKYVGIITLEDIIEEILGNIEDETDEISHEAFSLDSPFIKSEKKYVTAYGRGGEEI